MEKLACRAALSAIVIISALIILLSVARNRSSEETLTAAATSEHVYLDDCLDDAVRLELEVIGSTKAGDTYRFSPVIIDNHEDIVHIVSQLKKRSAPGVNELSFTTTLNGQGARIVIVSDKPTRFYRLRIVGNDFVALGEAEAFCASLPDDSLFRNILTLCEQEALHRPSIAMQVE
jgi:hypothetical protein